MNMSVTENLDLPRIWAKGESENIRVAERLGIRQDGFEAID